VDDDEDDDRSLLERWRDGDRVAGNLLFDRHVRSLMRFFFNKVGDETADLVQHTMSVCLCGGDRLRDDSSFRTYLFQTARDVLYEHLRRHRDGPFDPREVTLAELGLIPSTAYAKDLQQRTLLQALQKLPIEDQVTLELYFIEGLRGPELAVVLDVPEAAVPRRIRLGRDRLRALMETLDSA
jgi:RNA polymerase sigma factor (sigma-70 family)